MDWIRRQPRVVALNGLSASDELRDAAESVVWAEGWDESVLRSEDYPTVYESVPVDPMDPSSAQTPVYPALVSTRFLEERGLSLGDTFPVSFLDGRYWNEVERMAMLEAARTYRAAGSRDHIFVPLSFATPLYVLQGDVPEDVKAPDRYRGFSSVREQWRYFYYRQQTFETCRFTLSSAANLEQSRRHLRDAGFSSVGRLSRVRSTILLRDAAFMKLTETLERSMATERTVLAVISLAVLVTGFIVSWLMIHSRRGEFALMRGFGTPPLTIFASFFAEQALLRLAGCLAGAAAAIAFTRADTASLRAAGAFFACYLAGCAGAVVMTGRMKLMELFAYRD